MPFTLAKMKKVLTYVTPFRTLVAICCIYLFLTTCYFVIAALSNALNMDTYAANGTFQLYNPLRRLLEGQVIGKDFPFFHGVGVPLLHYPAFYAFGHNVFAADAVKWLVSPLVFLLTSYTFFWTFFRKISHSIIATAILTILALVCIDVVWPGNSLVGIRTTLPVLVAAFMLWRPKVTLRLKGHTFSLYQPIVFILLALAVAMGTEQGLAAIIAYMLVEVIRAIRSPIAIKRWWWRIVLKGVGVLAATYVVLSILTLGHATEALHYALIDVPKDQGWYFGAPPNGYLAWDTLWYIFDTPVRIYMWPIIALGTAVWIIGHRTTIVSSRESYVFSFLAAYGVIVFFASALGYWAPNAQLIPLTRAFGVILIAMCVRVLLQYLSRQRSRKNKLHRYLPSTLYGILLITLGWYTLLAYKHVQPFPVIPILKEAKNARHAPDGTYASLFWKQRIQAFAPYIPEGATVWSTYTGLYDSMRGQLNTSTGGEDYIIHALGPERRQHYSDDFMKQQPDYAITLRPVHFPYEEWLWVRHWDFYSHLFENYTVVTDNGSHILWKRNEDVKPVDHAKTNSLQRIDKTTYRLSVEKADYVRLYEATVHYEITKPIPMSDKFSRYILSIDTPSIQRLDISLPGYEKQWTFPLIIKPGQTTLNLSAHTHGLIYGEGLTVQEIRYREINVSHDNTYPFYDNSCSYGGPLPYGISCDPAELGFEYYRTTSDQSAFTQSLSD